MPDLQAKEHGSLGEIGSFIMYNILKKQIKKYIKVSQSIMLELNGVQGAGGSNPLIPTR
jgi:hypothetical protein